MTTLGLIRHGVTDWNDEYRTQGHSDIPLNEKGRQQAELLSRRIGTEQWDYIYSSDLSRALETAEIIGKFKNIEVRTDPRLREMNCGLIEGQQNKNVSIDGGMVGLDWISASNQTMRLLKRQGVPYRHIRQTPRREYINRESRCIPRMTLKRLIPHIDMTEGLMNTSVTILHTAQPRWDCSVYNCTTHLM